MKTKNLGLAAYVKMNDVKLISVNGREFEFDTDKSEKQWLVEYQNTCCHKHDTTLCELRRLL